MTAAHPHPRPAFPATGAAGAAGPLTYRPQPRSGPAQAQAAQEALVRRHLPLVRRIAWHVHGAMSTIVEIDDLGSRRSLELGNLYRAHGRTLRQ